MPPNGRHCSNVFSATDGEFRPIMALRICYSDERDHDFIRWTSNLLRSFISEGSIAIVSAAANPDVMIAGIWKRHDFLPGVPAILISNENWNLFKPHVPLHRYAAVVGLYPPDQPCTFIEYPFAAVYYDVPVDALYSIRVKLLEARKTRFCCFVTSNTVGDLARKRVALFEQIGRWRHVDSAGLVLNNVNYLAPRGLSYLLWIAQYKYMICIENSRAPGYITEKPYQSWFAGTVPIYDGGCLDRLNPEAIIDAASDDVLSALQRLESSPEAYEAMRRAALSSSRLSLAHFEKQFRNLVIEPMHQRSNA